MDVAQIVAFRNQLRDARAAALRDAEGFVEIFLCLERLGYFLTRRNSGLRRYLEVFKPIVSSSILSSDLPAQFPEYHVQFDELFRRMVDGRNRAVHEGAYARHLTYHAVEVSLVFEDALNSSLMFAKHFMVREPVCALLWEPISFVRNRMLINSFSFLPVYDQSASEWRLVSDRSLAKYLRTGDGDRARLAVRLGEAVKDEQILLEQAVCVPPDEEISTVAEKLEHLPVLVVSDTDRSRLLGIITAFDIL